MKPTPSTISPARHLRARRILLTLYFITWLGVAATALARFSDADWIGTGGIPGVSGEVYATAVDDSGNLYIGGFFKCAGTNRVNNVAKWNGSSWTALGSGVNNYVRALAVSGSDLYAAGAFTTAGGVPANLIAKWNGTNWSPLGSGIARGIVNALAVSGGNVYAGGDFSNSVAMINIAKWDGSSWTPLGSGIGSYGYASIQALAVSGSDLYVGGYFGAGGAILAKWNGSSWSSMGSSGLSHVNALAVCGGDVYVGGWYGSSEIGVAKWDGSSWTAQSHWNTYGYSWDVYALAVLGSDLYVGGKFGAAGGIPAANIAKWDGTSWTALDSGVGAVTPAVYALAVFGNVLYAGGNFVTAGGSAASYVAKWNGTSWSALGSGLGGDHGFSRNTLYALAASGTNVYAGGNFLVAGSGAGSYLAGWSGSGWTAPGSGLGVCLGCGVYINALAVSGSDVYAGGIFNSAGGVAATNIAKWDGSTWTALGSGVNSQVYALAVSGSDVYAGGAFTTAGGMAANYIAKWNGSSWSPLGSGMNNQVFALAVSGGTLYAGGQFTTAGGISVNNVAKWDGSSWSPLVSGVGYHVHALAVSGSDVYVGGDFTNASGVAANHVAKWNGSGWSPLGLGVGPNVTTKGAPALSALAVSGSDVYAGGEFTTAGGIAATNIAKWNGSSWSALGSGTDDAVTALAVDGEWHLFVGGNFFMAGTNASPYAAIINIGSGPTIIAPPQSQTAEADTAVRFSVLSDGKPPPGYQWYFNGTSCLGGTEPDLLLANVTYSQSGTYTVVATNVYGAVTSAPAMLNVIAPVVRRSVPGVHLMAQAGSFLGLDYRDSLDSVNGWETMATMTLSSNSQFYFDLSEPLPSQRFYRSWQSGTPGLVPQMHLVSTVPAITLTGNISDKLRLDYINQIGPTDAWFTLDTVTLTNTSQLYFDTSAIGLPARLWRIVPVP